MHFKLILAIFAVLASVQAVLGRDEWACRSDTRNCDSCCTKEGFDFGTVQYLLTGAECFCYDEDD